MGFDFFGDEPTASQTQPDDLDPPELPDPDIPAAGPPAAPQSPAQPPQEPEWLRPIPVPGPKGLSLPR